MCSLLLTLVSVGCSDTSPSTNNITSNEVQEKDQSLIKDDVDSDDKEQTDTSSKSNNDEALLSSTFVQATVTECVDGDTVKIKLEDGQTFTLRLIGIDTPETKHPNKGVQFYGQEASDFTKSKLLNQTIYLERDVTEFDKYGRLLRYVWLTRPASTTPTDDEIKNNMFNSILVTNGYANVYTYPPDVKYNDKFTGFASEARNNNAGLWNEPAKAQYEASKSAASTANSNYNANAQSQKSTSGDLVITMTGKKYHRANCRTVKQIKQYVTASEAQSMGYDACKVCEP